MSVDLSGDSDKVERLCRRDVTDARPLLSYLSSFIPFLKIVLQSYKRSGAFAFLVNLFEII